MLKLHGFPASNYYNVPKLVLLEKELPFEEVHTWTGASEDFQPEYLQQSPMGKVPCLVTDQGPISESRAIVEYLEEVYPEVPLMPRDPFARARVRELCTIIELYLELPVRRTIAFYFMRKTASDRLISEVLPVLQKGVQALQRRTDFSEFLVGNSFTFADVLATIHIPTIQTISAITLGTDVFANVPQLNAYLDRLSERPTLQKVRQDRDANFPAFIAFIKQQYNLG